MKLSLFASALSFLAALKKTIGAELETCLEQHGYDIAEATSTEFSSDGSYKITLSWSHGVDMGLVCPDSPPIACLVEFDDETVAASGLHSASIDFTCGHPGPGYLIPHYDVHFYRYSKEDRDTWLCETGPGPACTVPTEEYSQPTAKGANFFHMNMDGDVMMNMPPGFMCDPTGAIPQQGLHCIDLSTVPATSADWTEPAYVVGSYHNDIAFIEPMASMDFVTSDGSAWEHTYDYAGQTIMNLPSKITWTTDDAAVTTITVEGKSAHYEGDGQETHDEVTGEDEVVHSEGDGHDHEADGVHFPGDGHDDHDEVQAKEDDSSSPFIS